MKQIVLALSLIMVAGIASADTVMGLGDVTVVESGGNLTLETVTWNSHTYTSYQLVTGETTRWSLHPTHRRPDRLWVEGDPVEPWMPTVGGTSSAKAGDVGSRADTLEWRVDGVNWISSMPTAIPASTAATTRSWTASPFASTSMRAAPGVRLSVRPARASRRRTIIS